MDIFLLYFLRKLFYSMHNYEGPTRLMAIGFIVRHHISVAVLCVAAQLTHCSVRSGAALWVGSAAQPMLRHLSLKSSHTDAMLWPSLGVAASDAASDDPSDDPSDDASDDANDAASDDPSGDDSDAATQIWDWDF